MHIYIYISRRINEAYLPLIVAMVWICNARPQKAHVLKAWAPASASEVTG